MSKKIDHCKLRIKTMEIELETVKNRDTARKFKPVIRDHNNKIKEYQQTLDWNQQNANDNHSSYGKRKSKPNSGMTHSLHVLSYRNTFHILQYKQIIF